MIRDKRKSEEYFKEYIDYQNARIISKEKKLAEIDTDIEKKNRINLSQIKYKMDLIFAEYSAGYLPADIKKTVESAIDTAVEMPQVSFEFLLNILALQVILDDPYKINKLLEKYNRIITGDKLLNCFAKYVCEKKIVWEGTFSISSIFDCLDKIDTIEDKENVLITYLATWYENRKDASWYESDKNNNNVYVGYWSFESAAIVKIFDIKESKISESIYYPSF